MSGPPSPGGEEGSGGLPAAWADGSSEERDYLKGPHAAFFPHRPYGCWEEETVVTISAQSFGIKQGLGPLLKAWKP